MIYFMQSISGGPVKIGMTEDLPIRHKQLEAHYGQSLAILATMPGGRDREREIHLRFAELRIGRTEQFRPDSELMTFIGRPLLADPNPDDIEAMSVEYKNGLRPVQFRLSDGDMALIEAIRESHGFPSLSAAIQYAADKVCHQLNI